MQVLIVEEDAGLAGVWSRHLERLGCERRGRGVAGGGGGIAPASARRRDRARSHARGGSAFAVADFASYRRPEARVVFVTRSSFFSDGSIFSLVPNACGFFRIDTPPEDLAAIVHHYAA
jgi:hypothetical protein